MHGRGCRLSGRAGFKPDRDIVIQFTGHIDHRLTADVRHRVVVETFVFSIVEIRVVVFDIAADH